MANEDDGPKWQEFLRIGDRLTDVRRRLGDSTVSGEQPTSALEEALADKIWLALGRRTDRAERFVAALRKRMS